MLYNDDNATTNEVNKNSLILSNNQFIYKFLQQSPYVCALS